MKSYKIVEIGLVHELISLALQLISGGYALTACWYYRNGDHAGAAFDLGFAILVAIWARK